MYIAGMPPPHAGVERGTNQPASTSDSSAAGSSLQSPLWDEEHLSPGDKHGPGGISSDDAKDPRFPSTVETLRKEGSAGPSDGGTVDELQDNDKIMSIGAATGRDRDSEPTLLSVSEEISQDGLTERKREDGEAARAGSGASFGEDINQECSTTGSCSDVLPLSSATILNRRGILDINADVISSTTSKNMTKMTQPVLDQLSPNASKRLHEDTGSIDQTAISAKDSTVLSPLSSSPKNSPAVTAYRPAFIEDEQRSHVPNANATDALAPASPFMDGSPDIERSNPKRTKELFVSEEKKDDTMATAAISLTASKALAEESDSAPPQQLHNSSPIAKPLPSFNSPLPELSAAQSTSPVKSIIHPNPMHNFSAQPFSDVGGSVMPSQLYPVSMSRPSSFIEESRSVEASIRMPLPHSVQHRALQMAPQEPAMYHSGTLAGPPIVFRQAQSFMPNPSSVPTAQHQQQPGRRKIHLLLREEERTAPVHARHSESGRTRKFFSKIRSKIKRSGSYNSLTDASSHSLDREDYVNGNGAVLHHSGLHEHMSLIDRGVIVVSWYDGTGSVELRAHVKKSVYRKLRLEEGMTLEDMRIIDESVKPHEGKC